MIPKVFVNPAFDFQKGPCSTDLKAAVMLQRPLIKVAANHIPASESEEGLNAQAAWLSHSVLGGRWWEAVGPGLETPGWKVCFGKHSGTAFGFLHLTRSPRHGMHSSARQSILDA